MVWSEGSLYVILCKLAILEKLLDGVALMLSNRNYIDLFITTNTEGSPCPATAMGDGPYKVQKNKIPALMGLVKGPKVLTFFLSVDI